MQTFRKLIFFITFIYSSLQAFDVINEEDAIIFQCPEDPIYSKLKVNKKIEVAPFNGGVQEIIYRYPESGETRNLIKCIKVTEIETADDAFIEEGGVGFRYVIIRFMPSIIKDK